MLLPKEKLACTSINFAHASDAEQRSGQQFSEVTLHIAAANSRICDACKKYQMRRDPCPHESQGGSKSNLNARPSNHNTHMAYA